MNKFTCLFLAICCFTTIGSKAATVSGTITNVSLSGPAASQKVYLMDSITSVGIVTIDSTITNGSGAYSFTVSGSISSGRFRIYILACGGLHYSSPFTTYSGSNLTINLSICTPITVSGTVGYSSAGPAPGLKVYLMDSSASLGVTYRDSTLTNSSGQFSFAVPMTVNMYRVYAYGCGTRWNSAFSYTSWGNFYFNLTLGCTGVIVRDTVRNSTSGLPVYGQKVYLLDSTATSYRLDSALTDKLGVAFFTVPPTVAPGTLRVFTYGCGLQSQTFSYSGSGMPAPTLYVCLSNAIVSGTVTNVTTSSPVSGQWVDIYDSIGTVQLFHDTVVTNASGFYSVKVPVSVPATGTMIASTQACGFRHRSTATYSGSSMTLNLSICATSTATVSGIVSAYGSGTPLAGRKVYLNDTSTSTGTIISRDSTVTNSSGFYSFSIPASVNTALYKIATHTCGNVLNWQFIGYMGYSVVRNFTVCTTTALATVSGTIVNPSGAPIAGATVSLNSTVTTTTNSSGAYTLAIPPTWTLGSLILWGASTACGQRNATFLYTGSSIVRTDTLYNTNCHTVSGTVTKQGGGAAASAKVYLIGQFYDTTVTPIATILQVVDSTITNASGQWSITKNSIWIMPQRIKATLQPSDPSYWNYLPTYHDSSLNWSGADTFSYPAWINNRSNLNVSLRSGTNPGGPAFIGGNVLVGANKSTSVGDPLAQRILLLTTAADVAVGYTYSDAMGAFSFPGLPYGTYKLFGDAGGKTNPPLLITLSAGSPSVGNVIFEENSSTFKGHIANVGVSAQSTEALHIYPNPAGAYLTVEGLEKLGGSKTIYVRNVTGAVVSTMEVPSGNAVTISTKQFPAGVYLLQLQSAAGIRNYRFVKE